MTPAQKLHRENNNMDAIRYVMAFSVVVAHFNELCGFDIPWPISSSTGVGGFFALSGFLILHSYRANPGLRRFLTARAMRILPPYFLIVLLCAFLLAPVSDLTAAEYFGAAQWWRYLAANLTFLNFLEPALPGVFGGPEFATDAVNGSLWTMKVEWCLYLTVPLAVWLLGRMRRAGETRLFGWIIVGSTLYSLLFTWLWHTTEREIYAVLGRQFFGQLSFFYVGALAFTRLDTLLRRRWLILALLAAGWLLMQTGPYARVALRPVVEGGLVIWFSMTGSWGKYISRHDNVSYDIYLFHFPVLQLAVWLGLPAWGQWPCLLAAVAVTVVLSRLSWNLVGRPALRRRRRKQVICKSKK